MVYNLYLLLKRDRDKGDEIKAFCDKGQNSCYDVDLS